MAFTTDPPCIPVAPKTTRIFLDAISINSSNDLRIWIVMINSSQVFDSRWERLQAGLKLLSGCYIDMLRRRGRNRNEMMVNGKAKQTEESTILI
jgi:hypothetical protein